MLQAVTEQLGSPLDKPQLVAPSLGLALPARGSERSPSEGLTEDTCLLCGDGRKSRSFSPRVTNLPSSSLPVPSGADAPPSIRQAAPYLLLQTGRRLLWGTKSALGASVAMLAGHNLVGLSRTCWDEEPGVGSLSLCGRRGIHF